MGVSGGALSMILLFERTHCTSKLDYKPTKDKLQTVLQCGRSFSGKIYYGVPDLQGYFSSPSLSTNSTSVPFP